MLVLSNSCYILFSAALYVLKSSCCSCCVVNIVSGIPCLNILLISVVITSYCPSFFAALLMTMPDSWISVMPRTPKLYSFRKPGLRRTADLNLLFSLAVGRLSASKSYFKFEFLTLLGCSFTIVMCCFFSPWFLVAIIGAFYTGFDDASADYLFLPIEKRVEVIVSSMIDKCSPA